MKFTLKLTKKQTTRAILFHYALCTLDFVLFSAHILHINISSRNQVNVACYTTSKAKYVSKFATICKQYYY